MTVTPGEVAGFGGCLWPIDTGCAGDEWDVLTQEQRDRAHALATATLTRLTGGRVSACPITVRPCKPKVGWAAAGVLPFYTGYPFLPSITATGAWINVGCCSSPSCACETTCSVALPRPVSRIEEVKVNGQVIAPTDYFISGDNRLVWSGEGTCPFPATQDLSKPDTEDGTFSVRYLNAYPVDSIASCAVGILAMEYAKAMRGNKCRLPSGVTSIVRQGVTMEIAGGMFVDGVTGIREVDSFIALWNPGGLRQAPGVWSPDVSRPRVQR